MSDSLRRAAGIYQEDIGNKYHTAQTTPIPSTVLLLWDHFRHFTDLLFFRRALSVCFSRRQSFKNLNGIPQLILVFHLQLSILHSILVIKLSNHKIVNIHFQWVSKRTFPLMNEYILREDSKASYHWFNLTALLQPIIRQCFLPLNSHSLKIEDLCIVRGDILKNQHWHNVNMGHGFLK